MTIDQAYQLALQHHQAGRLAQAEPIYRGILAQQPGHAGAMQRLGLIAHQMGHHDAAVELIRKAIALNPGDADAHNNLGVILNELRQNEAAIAAYRAAIALRPTFAAAYNNLGVSLTDKKLWENAIVAFRQALAWDPENARAYSNMGIALKENGQLDDAIASYRRAVAIDGNYPQAYSNLSNALTDQKHYAEAVAVCHKAIALRPGYAEAHHNLARALRLSEKTDEAIAASGRAIALNPRLADCHDGLGLALADNGQFDEAIAAYRQAIALRPDFSEAWRNLAVALHDSGRVDEAIEAYRRAIAIDPNFAEAHRNLSISLRTRGDFAQGWEENEWRWKCEDFTSPIRDFPQPIWDGRTLNGATLLLHAEQGLGDTIQFIRYLPLVKQRGGTVIVECGVELVRLLQPYAGECQVIGRGEPIPDFDFQCPLMSLPRLFGTTLQNIPPQDPLLTSDAAMVERWRQRMGEEPGVLKVGLTWAGNKFHKNDRNRSVGFSALTPLGMVPNVRFFSLQKVVTGRTGATARADNLVATKVTTLLSADFDRDVSAGLKLVDWTEELTDFSDTAALVANLDLVISVDTSVAHLAGAMGKPVWVMLPFVADWRWLMERDDSPWYPTMRLFRQPTMGDWNGVVNQIAMALLSAPSSFSPGGHAG